MQIVITATLDADQAAELRAVHPEVNLIFVKEEELDPFLPTAEVLFVSHLSVEQLQISPKLRMVQIPYAGMDQLPLAEMKARGVLLANARIHGDTIGELTMGMMLALARSFAVIQRNQQQHAWVRVPQHMLMGSTLALVGVGALGSGIASRARSFGMKTLGFTHSGRENPYIDESFLSRDLLSQVGRADFLVAACPLTEETHRMIGKPVFEAMKPDAFFLNVGRGPVVDEEALIEALREGSIAGAALDVFEIEPLPIDSPLWDMPNVICFPHLAGNLEGNHRRAAQIFIENISNLLQSKPLTCAVNLDKGY